MAVSLYVFFPTSDFKRRKIISKSGLEILNGTIKIDHKRCNILENGEIF